MWKFNRWLSFSIINYFYFGVKLMGIAHFKFDSKTNRFIPSPFSTLYGILVFLSIFVLLPLSTYEFMLLDVYFLNTPMTFIEFAKSLDMSRSTIIHMAAYVTFMFYRKEWPELLNEGIDLYRATNEASEQDFFGTDGKFLVVFLIKFVKGWLPCFGVINSFLSYAEYYQFHGLDYIVKMLEWIIFMLTLIDNSFLSTIYMCGILYAAHLYRLLNTRLQVITQQLRWCDGITISECCFLSDKVDELSQIYLRITKFTQKFNALFSPLLLVMFFCNFTSTVFEMFYLYLNFVVSEIPFELDATQNIGDIIFLISGALQICFVIYAGNKISERARKTGALLCICSQLQLDERLERSIETFSIHLFHQKLDVTIYDLFKIDYTLIFSMIGAITNYLIISVQFQIANGDQKVFRPIIITNATFGDPS